MKTLVLYYSWDDTTAELARQIASEQGADTFRLEAVEPYPTDRHQLCQRVIKELDEDSKPEYISPVNLQDYDTVYIGSPIWIWHLPQLVKHFLLSHDFSGKRIVPFCTCLYEGEKKAINEILKYASTEADVTPHIVWQRQNNFAYIAE